MLLHFVLPYTCLCLHSPGGPFAFQTCTCCSLFMTLITMKEAAKEKDTRKQSIQQMQPGIEPGFMTLDKGGGKEKEASAVPAFRICFSSSASMSYMCDLIVFSFPFSSVLILEREKGKSFALIPSRSVGLRTICSPFLAVSFLCR